jgi:hypothetical protein
MNKYLLPIFFVIASVMLRLLPHIPNFTPIAAIALFGGVYLNKKLAFVLPLGAMIISDYFIGFHNTMFYVYGSFILIGLIGLHLRRHKNVVNVVLASLSGSILFYFITNAGVWINGAYARDITGLYDSLIMGLPFFRYTVSGDLVYVTLFFGAYELGLRFAKKTVTAKL